MLCRGDGGQGAPPPDMLPSALAKSPSFIRSTGRKRSQTTGCPPTAGLPWGERGPGHDVVVLAGVRGEQEVLLLLGEVVLRVVAELLRYGEDLLRGHLGATGSPRIPSTGVVFVRGSRATIEIKIIC